MPGLDEKYRIVELPRLEDPIEKLVKELTQGVKLKALGNELGINENYIHTLRRLVQNQGILTRMPFDISIY